MHKNKKNDFINSKYRIDNKNEGNFLKYQVLFKNFESISYYLLKIFFENSNLLERDFKENKSVAEIYFHFSSIENNLIYLR
jgi:hypothetical protein